MTTVKQLSCILILCLGLSAQANPCEGNGAIIFFINGLFNREKSAQENLNLFKNMTHSMLSEIKNLKYDLAWVEGMNEPTQLALAFAQRGVDDFQRFWLWVNGLEKAPDWFNDLVNRIVIQPTLLNRTALPRLKKQLELYSKAVIEGHKVILVSHSVGGFYANAALRALPDYVPASLQPSINKRHGENPYYPKTEEIVLSVQIASPVAETVNKSPWVTFYDDAVINGIRLLTTVLPGNIRSSGASEADNRSHHLASYLRVKESRDRIIHFIQSVQDQLRYPIPFFQPAATVQFHSEENSRKSFSAGFFLGDAEITEVKEVKNPGLATQYFAKCYNLRPGTVEIKSETIMNGSADRNFRIALFSGEGRGGLEENLINSRAIAHWRLGQIFVTEKQDHRSLDVRVEFLKEPQLEP